MRISIITATYNSATTIRDAFDSLLRQSHYDYEYIVVDGGSTDGTVEIIKEYTPLFGDRLKWTSKKDRGLYDAMNKGMRMASGDIIGFLNSDDFYTSTDILTTISEHFDANKDIDAIYGDVHFINSNNPTRCVRYYSSKIFRPWLMRFGYMPAHPSFYARKSVYDRYGGYSLDYKLASDYEIMVRFFCKHNIKADYIEKDFVTMRLGGISNHSILNRLRLTHEDALACRCNGIYSNFLLCSTKYFTKIFEYKWL